MKWDKDRLITSEENDEYLLVGVETNTTIALACRYCSNEHEEPQPKIWYHQDRRREKAEREVELGMDNNVSYNRIHTTPDLSLIIKSLSVVDAGIYRCHGEEGQEEENKYNYRIEPILRDVGDEYVEEGNITEWERYRETYLSPVATRFAVSKMTDLAEIREEGVTLQVASEWGPWSPCTQCVNNRGIKTSRGYCRLKRSINPKTIGRNESTVIYFFRGSPTLPCKSSAESQVVWRKDSLILKKGTGRSFRKKDEEARVMVDTFSTLYLIDVSVEEQGNYSCYVDKINMMRVKVVVVSKTRLLTRAFFRHLGYLGFIFFLTSFCYCAGVIITCRQRDKFLTVPQDEPSEKEFE